MVDSILANIVYVDTFNLVGIGPLPIEEIDEIREFIAAFGNTWDP